MKRQESLAVSDDAVAWIEFEVGTRGVAAPPTAAHPVYPIAHIRLRPNVPLNCQYLHSNSSNQYLTVPFSSRRMPLLAPK